MMPLGLHHIFAWGHHYGPEPWCDIPDARPDWLPPYYHRADNMGIGFDRSSTGSNATGQYHSPLCEQLDNVNTCPENLLLWFHHVPWNHQMKSGRTLWAELCYTYDRGVNEVRNFQKVWDRMEQVDAAEHTITVKGPKGTLHSKFHPLMTVAVEGNEILVTRPNDEKEARSLHGLTRTLIHNMVVGVTEGFRKDLEIQGVGYRAAKQGSKLTLTLGFSHPVEFEDTDTIKIELKDALHFSITGIDKQEVGQFAAEVRGVRPPEPYKGKGIRYVGEYVIRKEGKAGKGK